SNRVYRRLIAQCAGHAFSGQGIVINRGAALFAANSRFTRALVGAVDFRGFFAFGEVHVGANLCAYITGAQNGIQQSQNTLYRAVLYIVYHVLLLAIHTAFTYRHGEQSAVLVYY